MMSIIILMDSCTPNDTEGQTQQTIGSRGLSDGGGNKGDTADIPK